MVRIMQLKLGPDSSGSTGAGKISNEKKKTAKASIRAVMKKSNAPSDAVAKKASSSSIYVLCTHLLISSTTHVSSRYHLSAQEPAGKCVKHTK